MNTRQSFFERFEDEWAPQLRSWDPQFHRDESFRALFHYVSKMRRPLHIVETGTMRPGGTFGGDGKSTLMFDAFTREFNPEISFWSIDSDKAACEYALANTNHSGILHDDSIAALSRWVGGIDVLYLDSYDYHGEGHESALHQLQEFAVANRLLLPGSVVMTDDCLSYHPPKGKGKYLIPLMNKIGAELLIKGVRQVAWVMP